MFRSILVAYDNSDHARVAIRTACEVADAFSAKLHIIHVPQVTGDTMMIGYSAVPLPPSNEELARAGEEALAAAKAIAAEHGHGEAHGVVRNGDPAHEIVSYGKAENIDLIIMGRRGLGQFGALLVGSVTHKVSQLADCAVLTIK